MLSRASSIEQVVLAYGRQFGMLEEFARMQVLPFGVNEAKVIAGFNAAVRIGTMDKRIAATAIANEMTLLTRNTVDFAKVPGLRFDDWTRPLDR